VTLAKPSTISRVQVSAFKNTTASRFAALKDFTVQVSDDGVLWKTVSTGGFGYQAPRPAAPDLNYRTFDLAKPTKASYVRFFVDSVQGETLKYAQVAELQVFGAAKGISPVAPPADPTFTDSGTIAVGNPSTGELLETVIGATGTEFSTTCPDPYAAPASQGADGWITKLPAGFGDGTHTVSVVGEETPAGHDLDVYYLDSACQVVGSTATSAADESGVIPGGAAYVLTQLWSGADVPFTLTAVDAGSPVDPFAPSTPGAVDHVRLVDDRLSRRVRLAKRPQACLTWSTAGGRYAVAGRGWVRGAGAVRPSRRMTGRGSRAPPSRGRGRTGRRVRRAACPRARVGRRSSSTPA
jgi:hypothetical protein